MMFFLWGGWLKPFDACWQASDLPRHGRCTQPPLHNFEKSFFHGTLVRNCCGLVAVLFGGCSAALVLPA